jgi:hypothetical protein
VYCEKGAKFSFQKEKGHVFWTVLQNQMCVCRKRLKAELEMEQRTNQLLKEQLNQLDAKHQEERRRHEEDNRKKDQAAEEERRRWEERERKERTEQQRLVLLSQRLEEELNRRKEAETRLSLLKNQLEKEGGLGSKIKDLGTGIVEAAELYIYSYKFNLLYV